MTSSELKHQADAGVGAGNTGVPEQWDVRAGMVPPTGGHANNILGGAKNRAAEGAPSDGWAKHGLSVEKRRNPLKTLDF